MITYHSGFESEHSGIGLSESINEENEIKIKVEFEATHSPSPHRLNLDRYSVWIVESTVKVSGVHE